ncbi:MAG: hypothetical protein QG661_2932, partial [Actinomycetota bacterium]|nr:hypothetical protein [Actinomycetota bacterium]
TDFRTSTARNLLRERRAPVHGELTAPTGMSGEPEELPITVDQVVDSHGTTVIVIGSPEAKGRFFFLGRMTMR